MSKYQNNIKGNIRGLVQGNGKTVVMNNGVIGVVGEVYQHQTTREKVVVLGVKSAERVSGADWVKVADEPHGDGDFSYLCGSTYCRCRG